MKKLSLLLIIPLLCGTLLLGCGEYEGQPEGQQQQQQQQLPEQQQY